MSKSFDLGAYLRGQTAAVSESDTERIVRIRLDLIDPDPNNFYSLNGIEELAANIETVGLLDPLRVRPAGERYTVVSGHRRRAACLMIRDGGSDMFDKGVPCIVDLGEASEAMRELRLIYANSATRVMGPAEIARQAERVTELLYKLKEEGVEFPGRMRDHVAEACQVSAAKIARLTAIRNNLRDCFQPLFASGKLSESAAYRISQEDPEFQDKLFARVGVVVCNHTVYELDSLIEIVKRPPACSQPAEPTVNANPEPTPVTRKTEPEGRGLCRRILPGVSVKDDADLRLLSRAQLVEICRLCEGDTDVGSAVPCEYCPLDDDDADFRKDCINALLEAVADMLEASVSDPDTEEDPATEVYMGRPHWQTGDVPWEGRYLCRIDMQDGGTHEATGEYRGGSWSVFGGPLYEGMKIREWWPLPEKGGA